MAPFVTRREALALGVGGFVLATLPARALQAAGPSLPLMEYVSRYRDPQHGDVLVLVEVLRGRRSRLRIRFRGSEATLEPILRDSFRASFPRGAGGDVLAAFTVENSRVTELKLRPLSPRTDITHALPELDAVRVEERPGG